MTDSQLVIGIDIGTTGVKSVLVDVGRGIIAQSSRANALTSTHAGWAEADPGMWLSNVLETLAELATVAGGRSVTAIATTGMVPAVVCLDVAGNPLRNAILQNDARAGAEVDRIAGATTGSNLLDATGSVPSQQSVAPKAMWLAQHEPDTWAKTRWVVGSYDWILAALGAQIHVESNWALESGLFDFDGHPFPAVNDQVRGLAERLPPVIDPGQLVGELDPRVADRVGLARGIPLVTGGADHVLSAYCAGLVAPGDWLVKLGGAGDILAVADAPIVDERFFLDRHPVSGLWLPNGCMATSGSLVRWVQKLLSIADLSAMDAEATDRRAAEVLCLPYFLGEKSPRNDPDLRGVFAGMHLGHDAVDLYRSALEGIAFGFRHNADVMRGRGIAMDQATVTNGGATSLLWKQIHASVLGVPLRTVRNHPGASLGAAFAAGRGTAAFADWHAPLELIEEGETIDPVAELINRYDEAFGLWTSLGDLTAPTMHALARR
ncbi:FGGY-family carbohydrate kinase [Microbacterium marmarense]|uniref:FGGY family carbohydrate kinase n=1 Tax=Microbacterium marmarense TaxID=3122051 RepID=A0ABU8LSM3_9MICO